MQFDGIQRLCNKYDDYDASNSQRVQNDQIEQMINDGCNVLCVNLADRTEPSEIIDAAKRKDIPIISLTGNR